MDTNVFISAMTSPGGINREVLRACLSGRAKPLMGIALYEEYEDVMRRPEILKRCPLAEDERTVFLDAFLSVCEWTSIYFLWRPNLRDEADNHLIELAVAGGASAIVTSNLRDLKSGELIFPTIQVLKPADFLATIA